MMRRPAAMLSLLLVLACSGPGRNAGRTGPLEAAGVQNGKTVWSGIVLMAGDVLVPEGSHLLIRPGTTVLVRDSESTKIDPEYLSAQTELLVRGVLEIDGQSDAIVTFLPEEPPADGQVAWAGIIIDRSEQSTVRHARIESADTGILVVSASPDIVGSTIDRSRYGIVIQGGSPRVLENSITRGEGGVFCWNGTTAYLKGNHVIANDEEGIVVDRQSRPVIDLNTVSGNGIGLVLPDDLAYDQTLVAGNTRDVLLLPARPGKPK